MFTLFENLIRPILFRMDPEKAHEFGIEALKLGLGPKVARSIATKRFASESFGDLERFGLKFENPVGIAAGFDKNALVVNQLASLGFGFVEVGTVTYEPQPGNEKPRLFRLPADKALINRLGFNNDGASKIVERLRKIGRKCIVGVNIGRNKNVPNEEAVENYLKSFDLVFEVADYIAVNISSPNTPGLRELQHADHLEELLRALQEKNSVLSSNVSWPASNQKPPEGGTQNRKPLLVKIAPELSEAEIEAIVDICMRLEVGGVIATNTTIGRDGLKSPDVASFGEGGLSGKPLSKRSNEVISAIYLYSKGKLPIIGVGGVFTAKDAFEKIAAGASLIQAYTGFIYCGPAFARDINQGLLRILGERGFSKLDDAIGSIVN